MKQWLENSWVQIQKDLVIVTGYQESKLYHILNNKYHFENDQRVKFVGTIYDDALLKSVRKMPLLIYMVMK